MRIHARPLDAKASESLAIEALAFLVENSERAGRFLSLTGVAPEDVRALTREPAFLAAVLEHVVSDAVLLAECAERTGHDPETLDRARALLAGGDWERDTA